MSPARINAWRAIATWIIRAAALALLALGAYLVLKRIVMAVVTRDLESAFFSWMETGEGHSLYRGVAMLIVGAILAIVSERLARWMMPVPRSGCPRCGYEKIEQGRCPECGLSGFGTRE